MKIRQTNVGTWWGALMTLGGRINSYVSLINLGLLLIFSYSSVADIVFKITGIQFTLWGLMLVIFIILCAVMVIEYKFSLASIASFNNNQWYKHDNMMRRDLENIKEQNQQIKEDIVKLMQKIDKL